MALFEHRALMLDPARLMENKQRFHWILPWMARWGYNALHLHFADDQGLRLRLPSCPELADDDAFEPDEMRQLIAEAREHGIAILPELESFGHTRFITRHERYRHLAGETEGWMFNAIDPEHPDTRTLLAGMIGDVAEIFDAPLIHVGLDEVNLRTLPKYRDLPDDQLHETFGRFIAWVHAEVRQRGRRPAMWGDHLLRAPALMDHVERDVLIYDWHYQHDHDCRTLDRFCDAGYEVWGGPATMWAYSRVMPNADNLENLRRFSSQAALRRGRGERGVTGMVNTVWVPWRFLPGACDAVIGLAGHLFNEEAESERFFEDFCGSFYELPRDEAAAAAEALQQLHHAAPPNYVYNPMVFGELHGHRFGREERRLGASLALEAGEAARALEPLIERSGRNRDRLEDMRLSALILERVGRFAAKGRDKSDLPDATPLVDAVLQSWRSNRPAPAELHAPPNPHTDHLLQALHELV